MSQAYCYNEKCSSRTKDKPWPSSEGVISRVTMISKNNKPYRRKLFVCKYCSERMTFTFSIHADEFQELGVDRYWYFDVERYQKDLEAFGIDIRIPVIEPFSSIGEKEKA